MIRSKAAMKFQAPKGMSDILPGEVEHWQRLEATTRQCFEAHGFREIRTPVLEPTELFTRSIGEASDIVHKEMYTFEDRGSRSLTLRPEMTASVVRAAIEHSLIRENRPLRLYYGGPMFRAERPQAGRRRQFYQWGVEILNAPPGGSDLEVLRLLARTLREVGLKTFHIRINNLGVPETRAAYQGQLKAYFQEKKNLLCEDCRYRLERNVLRMLDCKNELCAPVLSKAPALQLKGEERDRWDTFCEDLKAAGVSAKMDPRLVRGLDYYTGCVFEATAGGLGAQNAVAAGGRYDGLVKRLGGPDVGACGFAVGVERILEALQQQKPQEQPSAPRVLKARAGGTAELSGLDSHICFAVLDADKQLREFAIDKLAMPLSALGFHPVFDWGETSLSKHLKRANSAGYPVVVILGATEFSKGHVLVKDLRTGEQREVPPEEACTWVLQKLGRESA